jgi:hypothetical protein
MQLDWTTDTTWKRIYEPKSGTKSKCDNLDEVGAGSGDGEEEDEDDEPPVVRKCLVNLSDC